MRRRSTIRAGQQVKYIADILRGFESGKRFYRGKLHDGGHDGQVSLGASRPLHEKSSIQSVRHFGELQEREQKVAAKKPLLSLIHI